MDFKIKANSVESKEAIVQKPHFLIIGVNRCGTTAFYDLICQHSKVKRATHKELGYFTFNHSNGMGWYLKQFPICQQGEITGEATPDYFWKDEQTPKEVKDSFPSIKLILLLRNPVARSYSNYQLSIRNRPSNDKTSFIEGFRAGKHKKPSLYSEYLKRWLIYFPLEEILILTKEELGLNHSNVMEKFCKFMNIPYEVLPEVKNFSEYPDISEEDFKEANEFFKPYNEELFSILGKRLW